MLAALRVKQIEYGLSERRNEMRVLRVALGLPGLRGR
jgi:hypothetical protein